MALLIASAIGVMIGCGVYLLLRPRSFDVVLGLTLISYGVNVFLFSMGRLTVGIPPVLVGNGAAYADPLPQALVLTAIVISFALTALLLVLALRANSTAGTDHVEGEESR